MESVTILVLNGTVSNYHWDVEAKYEKEQAQRMIFLKEKKQISILGGKLQLHPGSYVS